MNEILGLIGFSFVSAGTPGPNNVLLWASGATFGFRRTVPHIVGTALGIGAMTVAVAAGLGVVITTVPGLAVGMKIAGSVYLLYLAYQIARAGSLDRATVARPMSLLRAAGFQAINPKGWIFALGAITTFRPPELPIVAGSILVAGIMMVVILPSATLWAAGGGALSRLMESDRTRRIVSLGLAAIVAATVAYVWL